MSYVLMQKKRKKIWFIALYNCSQIYICIKDFQSSVVDLLKAQSYASKRSTGIDYYCVHVLLWKNAEMWNTKSTKYEEEIDSDKKKQRDWAEISENSTDTGLPSTSTNLIAMARQNTSNPKLGHYIKKANKNDCPDLIKEYCNNFLLEMETH